MFQGNIKIDYLVGNGAAQSIELGWIPDLVILTNVTDGDKITIGWIGPSFAVPFSSGGTTEVTVGSVLTGATSGATAVVKEVLQYSGTWPAGDAAGFFIVDMLSGTFGSEAAYISSDTTAGVDDATVTANVTHTVSIDTEVATEGTDTITRYNGSAASASKGFTIAAGVAEEAKLLRYIAIRGDM